MVPLLVHLLDVYSLVVIASAIISWFPGAADNPIGRVLRALTEPVYAIIHKVLDPSKTGGIDLSPLIVLVVLQFLKKTLLRM